VVSASIVNNQFYGSGTEGGMAIGFYNWDNDNPTFNTFEIGGAGNENTFYGGIGTFIYLDNSSGPANPNATTMVPWAVNLNIENNLFASSPATLPANMTLAQLFALEDKVFHAMDNALALGLVTWVPSNVYVTTNTLGIQRGIDAASAGNIVNVNTGNYNEKLLINKGLTLEGVDGAVLDGTGLGPVTGVSIKSGNVTFNNIDVANFGGNGIICGYESNPPGGLQNIQITNCVISNILPGSSHGFGIYAGYQSEGFPGTISAHLDYSGLIISGNEIHNTANAALVLQSITSSTGSLLVSDNHIHNSNASGIWIDCARELLISGNEINSNSNGIFMSSGGNWYEVDGAFGPKSIDIINNIISNNSSNGVAIYAGWPLTLKINDNSFTLNGDKGVNNQISSSSPIDASCNWWGTADGDLISGMISGPVTIANWLNSGGNSNSGYGFIPTGNCTGSPVVIESATLDHIICGETEGSIKVVFSGGTANYTIDWEVSSTTVTNSDDYTISGLAAGTYVIIVTDANGSSVSTSAEVFNQPVYNSTALTYHTTIQAAIDATTTGDGDVIEVCAGTYVEDLEIDKSITLLGPNAGISPNTETRVAEATIIPFETDAAQAYITASDVTIDGFTFNGNNPSLASGYPGTNGADIDAAAAVYQNADNINNLVVKNNIIQNQTYMGIYLFGGSYSAPSTTGNLIDDNLFKDLGHYGTGLSYANWGGGVMLYNNQYTRITNNVMQNVRIGIQTGNFSRANIGSSDYQVIANNTIEARRRGIFHNLHYGPTSPYTLSNNNITALDNTNESVWDGIFFGSMSVDAFGINNTINGSGVTNPSEGIEIWNVKSTTPVRISGGSVSNVVIGVFANNFEGYNSNGTDGAHAVISGVTITPKTGGVGVKAYDSPSYTGVPALVSVEVKDNCSISGAATGILAEGADASVTVTNNLTTITGNQVGILVKDGADLASVTGNTITNNTHGGIIIEATAGTIGVINNNTISGNGYTAFQPGYGLGLKNGLDNSS
jgi:nitrous oxidase accessory protein NosD